VIRTIQELSLALRVVLTVVAAGVAYAFIASVIGEGAQPASQSDEPTQSVPAAVTVSVDVGGSPHELVYDPERRTIWAAVYGFEGDDTLVEFNPETRAVRKWALPPSDVRPITAKLRLRPMARSGSPAT
jgi:DNA-binding beta-propeller fold protein YncE